MTVIHFPERIKNSENDIEQLRHIAKTVSDIAALSGSALDGSYLIDNISDQKMERIRLGLETLCELSKSINEYSLELAR